MRALVGNTVKTDVGDYACATREEAEALFMSLKRQHPARQEGAAESETSPRRKPPRAAKRARRSS